MIYFQSEDIDFILKNKTLLKKWITLVIEKKKKKTGDINFIFCSDSYLLDINQHYLKHDTFTDIITFDYSKNQPKTPISGDIFISIERVRENANKYTVSFENELHRIIIHGVLHLLGHSDKKKSDKEEMTKAEDSCLKLLEKSKKAKTS